VAAGEPVGVKALGLVAADRRTARRFLRPREASWHDGDENRVRAFLDHWTASGEDPRRARARALLLAAADAAGAGRAETLWFLLWAMEGMLEGLAAGDD
jgi:hypothetical protein